MLLRLTVLLSVGGEPLTLPGDLPGDNLAFKFCRGGVSDQLHSRLGGVICPLHYSAVRDNGCGSRICWIRPHPLHFRPSCKERGGKGLIAALSDALKIEHVEMQLLPDIFARGVLKRPGFHKTGVARLRRAPRWLRLTSTVSGDAVG